MLALVLAFQLLSPAGEAPYRQPQAATDGKTVGVAFGAGNAVYFARQTGEGFSAPVKVAAGTFLALGRHRGPRIAMAPAAIVISAIVGEKRGQDGDVMAWRSVDGGKSWPERVRVNDVAASAREGLHTMAYGGGTLFAAWLDLREKGTRIYGAASKDGGRTWGANRLVYSSPSGSVCECCHPTALVDEAGRIAGMFRNAAEGARDMYLARSKDGVSFAPAEKLGRGTWMLNACPMDGGGLAAGQDGKVVSVWRRDKEVFLARAGEAETRLAAGKDASVAVTAKGTYAVWTSGTSVMLQAPGREPEVLTEAGGFGQVMALPGGGVMVVWEAGSGIARRRWE